METRYSISNFLNLKYWINFIYGKTQSGEVQNIGISAMINARFESLHFQMGVTSTYSELESKEMSDFFSLSEVHSVRTLQRAPLSSGMVSLGKIRALSQLSCFPLLFRGLHTATESFDPSTHLQWHYGHFWQILTKNLQY